MKKFLTKILLYFLDRDIILNQLNLVSKNELKGQFLLNKQILDEIKDFEKHSETKINQLFKLATNLNICINKSTNFDENFLLIHYLSEEGERKVKKIDFKNLTKEELSYLLNIFEKYSKNYKFS